MASTTTAKVQTLTDGDRKLIDKLFSNPLVLPAVFKQWLISYLGPEIQVTQSQVVNAATAFFVGNGTPEGATAAGVGSVYLRLDGGAGTTLYVKETGTGTTGWVERDVFTNGLTITDGKNITIGGGTGSEIGDASAKLGFFGQTPAGTPALTADLLDSLQLLGLIASGAGDTPLNLSNGALTAGATSVGQLTIGDGDDVVVGATTGSKIGQALSKLGFFGKTPVGKPSAYTQTYATADKTLNPSSTAAFTGINDAQAGTPYAKVVDLEQLRQDLLDLAQFVNALVDDAQALGLIG